MTIPLYCISLYVSCNTAVRIAGPICEWVSVPVFSRHFSLDFLKAVSSTRPDHGINFINNLDPPPSGFGISLAVIDTVSSVWRRLYLPQAPPHIETVYTIIFHLVSFCPALPFSMGNKIPPWTIACFGGVLTPHHLLVPGSWIIPKALWLASSLEPQ